MVKGFSLQSWTVQESLAVNFFVCFYTQTRWLQWPRSEKFECLCFLNMKKFWHGCWHTCISANCIFKKSNNRFTIISYYFPLLNVLILAYIPLILSVGFISFLSKTWCEILKMQGTKLTRRIAENVEMSFLVQLKCYSSRWFCCFLVVVLVVCFFFNEHLA